MEVSKHSRKSEKKKKTPHLTPKPIKLLSHLIRLFTQENHLVLDPFCGSGATALAALQNKRRFIGFEIEEAYFKFAKKRVMEVKGRI